MGSIHFHASINQIYLEYYQLSNWKPLYWVFGRSLNKIIIAILNTLNVLFIKANTLIYS